MKQKPWSIIAVVLSILVGGMTFIFAPSHLITSAQHNPDVLVRFIHAYPTNSVFDIYVNHALVIQGLAAGESSPYLRFPSGSAQVEVRGTGNVADSTPFIARTINFATSAAGFGQLSLLIQTDSFNEPSIARLDDILNPSQLGQARLQLIHAAPSVGAVDLIADNGAPFLQNVSFNTPNSTIDPSVGTYNFAIVPAGNRGGAVFDTLDPLKLRTGFLYTLVLMPTLDGAGLDTRLFIAPMLRDPASNSLQLQFIHASSSISALDVYVDDVLVFPNLEAGEILPHIPFQAGTSEFSIRPAGSPPNSDAAATEALNLISPSGALSVVIMGSLEDGTFTFAKFNDSLNNLDRQTVRVRVINGTHNGPLNLQLDDGTVIANVLPMEAVADVVDIPRARYSISGGVDDVALNGPISLSLPEQPFIGGSWVTILAFSADDEPILTISSTLFLSDASSLPDFVEAPPPSPTPLPPSPSPDAPISSSPSLAPQNLPTQSVPSSAGIPTVPSVLASVSLNQGVNLQCREYPTSAARSLGLIPNQSVMTVLGYAGPIDMVNGQQNTPLESGAFADSENASSFADIWLQVDWASPEQTTRCWIRADFVLLSFYSPSERTDLFDTQAFFELLLLEVSPLQRIPANYAGQIVGAGVVLPPVSIPSATPLPQNNTPSGSTILAVVKNTNSLRSSASQNSDMISTVATGATVQVLGRNADSTWLNVRYEVIGAGVYVGWLPVIELQLDSSVSLSTLPITG